MKSNSIAALVLIVALAALVVGVMALTAAHSAKELALSQVVVEEVNSLTTPVYDEESRVYSFLSLYDISIANMSGPAVTLTTISKAQSGGGFVMLLRGKEAIASDVHAKTIVSEHSSGAVKANPKLLKDMPAVDAGDNYAADLKINPGETKVLHLGLSLQPFTEEGEAVANMALVSWKLQFSNGKSFFFRRGFPIYAVRQ